jgi:hypothetical protein
VIGSGEGAMSDLESAFQWGRRTARIRFAVHAGDLFFEFYGGKLDLLWPWLVDEAKRQAALYQAPARFIDGYLEGAICAVWRAYGWDMWLLLTDADGRARWLEASEREWWEHWPRESGGDRATAAYQPLFPLSLVW